MASLITTFDPGGPSVRFDVIGEVARFFFLISAFRWTLRPSHCLSKNDLRGAWRRYPLLAVDLELRGHGLGSGGPRGPLASYLFSSR